MAMATLHKVNNRKLLHESRAIHFATAWLIADKYDEAIEDETTHLRVVAAFQW